MTRIACVWIIVGVITTAHGQPPQQQIPKVVSQCYKEQGFSFVSLYCGWNKLIQIKAAIHGRHRNPRIKHCGELKEDCTRDMLSSYDWGKCEGKHSCVQMIRSPAGETGGGRCQGGEHYLQVEYTCNPLPGSQEAQDEKQARDGSNSTEKRGKKRRKNGKKQAENNIEKTEGPEQHDICVNRTLSQEPGSSVLIHSPGYPDYYMAGTDCRCAVQAPKDTQVAVTYHELALVMRGTDLCVDWLLLQSPGHKESTAVTCGNLLHTDDDEKGQKTVLSQANWLLMHFHTAGAEGVRGGGGARGDGGLKKSMPGFKVELQAVPSGKINIKCYSVHPDVLNGLKKGAGNGLLLPATDLNQIAVTGAIKSRASNTTSSLATWILFVAAITLYNTIIVRVALH